MIGEIVSDRFGYIHVNKCTIIVLLVAYVSESAFRIY